MIDTVASSPSSPLALVKLIKRIYSTIRTTKKPMSPKEHRVQPIEVKHDWPYGRNGEILPHLACSPVQEHCIGLCQSPIYHRGRENTLYLSLNYLPLDWKSIRQIILKSLFPIKTRDLGVNLKVFNEIRHMKVENGAGRKVIDLAVLDDHIVMRITTFLPVDESFIVHGYSQEKPSSQQSRCWHMSGALERDCNQLIDRMRKPLIYSRVDCPDGYYTTGIRRCESCPSEYQAWVDRFQGVRRDQGPYFLCLTRWVDLGEYRKEEESEEFRALTAGQVCCDHLTRSQEPPRDCLWQGRDWSTNPSMRDRVERRAKEKEERREAARRKAWYYFWK